MIESIILTDLKSKKECHLALFLSIKLLGYYKLFRRLMSSEGIHPVVPSEI